MRDTSSLKRLWRISYPLIISSASTTGMLFCDRCMLAQFGESAFRAITTTGPFCWALVVGFCVVSGMGEILIARAFGAGRPSDMGRVTWNLLWIAAASWLWFLPLAILGPRWLPTRFLHGWEERAFFRWFLAPAAIFPIRCALQSFYIGRGQTVLITIWALVANGCNVALDAALIFGLGGWISPMGVRGAVLATYLGELVQVIALSALFVSRFHRSHSGSAHWRPDRSIARQVLALAGPPAVQSVFESALIAGFFQIIDPLGPVSVNLAGACHSIWMLLSFFPDGLYRGVAAMAGQCVGAGRAEMLRPILRASLLLQALFLGALMPQVFFGERWLRSLFVGASGIATSAADLLPLLDLRLCLSLTLLYLLSEGARWVLIAVLSALNDSKSPMICAIATALPVLFAPLALLVHLRVPVFGALSLLSLYALVNGAYNYYRFLRLLSR